jgi:hypothetical protein
MNNAQLKAQGQKTLGDLGELAVIQLLGKTSKNLNEIKNNFPLFDILDQSCFYTVKTRRKYTPTAGKLNGEYNLVAPGKNAQKLKSFYKAAEELGIEPVLEKLFWVAIPYEDGVWCPVYYGKLLELPHNPVQQFFEGTEVYLRIKMKEQFTTEYKVLGYARLDTINNTVEVKHGYEN